jgi:phosphatidate cytidylyltransferase
VSSGEGQAPKPRSKGAELRIRFLIGPSIIALLALLYWLDSTVLAERGMRGVLIAGLLGLLGLGGIVEYIAMLQKGGFAVARTLLLLFSAALFVSPFHFVWQSVDRELYPLVIGTIGLLFPIAVESLSRRRMQQGLELQGATMLGFLLIAWPMFLAQGMALRNLPAVLLVAIISKGGDIGAYLVGVAVGRNKLIPHVSGAKTIEGSIGGLATSVGLAIALRDVLPVFDHTMSLTTAVIVGVVLNITTQAGDLIESLLKRRCGVKDSSTLLPAHGGILDLIDSLLFSYPAFFLILAANTGPS